MAQARAPARAEASAQPGAHVREQPATGALHQVEDVLEAASGPP